MTMRKHDPATCERLGLPVAALDRRIVKKATAA
jgi:hypothetical protein